MIEVDRHLDDGERCLKLLQALSQGVGDAAFPLRREAELIVSAGTEGGYGAIMALRLDEEDESVVLCNSYVAESDADGRWICPQSSSGSALPASVLERSAHGLPDWQGVEFALVSSAFRVIDGVLVAGVSLMFSLAAASAKMRHGDDELTLAMPESGFVTVPVVVRSPDDVIRIEAFDAQDRQIEGVDLRYVPDDLML